MGVKYAAFRSVVCTVYYRSERSSIVSCRPMITTVAFSCLNQNKKNLHPWSNVDHMLHSMYGNIYANF